MQEFIDKAYRKIERTYANKKAKKFILHLMRAFLPIESLNFYMNTEQSCSITGKKGFSVNTYFELTKDLIIIKATAMGGNEEEKNNAQEKLNRIAKKVKDVYDIDEGEDIKQTRILYYSEHSDKCLSKAALIALQEFATNMMARGDRDVSYIFTQKRRFDERNMFLGEKEKVTPQINKPMTTTLGEMDVFKKLKDQLKD